jgi:fructose-specific phosphotransferase system IIC component
MNLSALQTVSKAIAAFIAGAIVSWLMKRNIVIADTLPDSLEVLISAVVTGAVVFFAPKNTEGQ